MEVGFKYGKRERGWAKVALLRLGLAQWEIKQRVKQEKNLKTKKEKASGLQIRLLFYQKTSE